MKHHIRQKMRATLAGLEKDAISTRSVIACDALRELPEFNQAQTVMIYLDIPHEVDASTIAHQAWKDGKTVLVPKVTWEHKYMIAHEIHTLESGLVNTPQGLREPEHDKAYPAGAIDFIVVPALAYDRSGNRLGRGGGFYDRFLAEPDMRAVTCGLAFTEQLVDELPVHANDIPVEILVTDEQVFRFNDTESHAKALQGEKQEH